MCDLSSPFNSGCFAASPICRCESFQPDIANKTQVQQDLWIQCDDCDKWRELSASQFEEVQVSSVARHSMLHTVAHFAEMPW